MSIRVDNFDLLLPLLNFDSDDTFYYCIVRQHKKDGNDHDHNVTHSFCIESYEGFGTTRNEIVQLCAKNNARAYINLNPRSYKHITICMLTEIATILRNETYSLIRNVFDCACSHGVHPEFWVVDIDDDNVPEIERIIQTTNCIMPFENCIVAIVPTVYGMHLITRKFDLNQFLLMHPDINVYKDGFTLLYYEKVS